MIDGSDAVADWPLLNFRSMLFQEQAGLVSTKAVEQVLETHYTQGW
jgi:urocanate hydratase